MQNRFNIENNRNKNKQLSEQCVKIRKYPVLLFSSAVLNIEQNFIQNEHFSPLPDEKVCTAWSSQLCWV